MRVKQNVAQLFLIPTILVAISIILFAVASILSSKFTVSPNAPITASPNLVHPNQEGAVSPEANTTSSASVAALSPEQATPPDPQALNLLLAPEISSATPKGNGYVVKTTFGSVWFLSQQEVESLPMSMKLRIDYGKYGAGAHGN
ncbi:MAG: hypothetical protein WCA07_16670 [Gloeobacterales cyanobacterium]